MISPLRSVGTVLAVFVVLNIILVPAYAAIHFQGTDLTSSSGTGSSIPKESYGRCELTAETPPVIRCGLNPSEDSYVDNFFPDKSFATLYWVRVVPPHQPPPSPVLIVQDTEQHHVEYGDVSLNYAYLKFDWAAFLPQELLLSHAEPRNATLWLYVRYVSPFYNASVRVFRALSNDWEEKTLTWRSRPALDKTTFAEASIRANGTWVPWDITEEVRAAVNEGSMISLVVMASETSWSNLVWFDSNDQNLEGSVSTRPELDLDFVAPVLTVQTPYPNLLVTIGGKSFETDQHGLFRAFVAWGNYQIVVPEVIPKDEGTRVVFVGWSDNISEPRRMISMGNNTTLQANYKTQYYLNVTSPHGTVNGSGWYAENQEALATVSPVIVIAEGISGPLGVRRVFNKWSQDCTDTQPECRVIMDGPKKATAVWKDDYTLTVLGAVILIVAAATFVLLKRKARRGQVVSN